MSTNGNSSLNAPTGLDPDGPGWLAAVLPVDSVQTKVDEDNKELIPEPMPLTIDALAWVREVDAMERF